MARRLVVVGGDAAGMGAASQARRLDPSLEIIALERGSWTSYSACGIPYLVGGSVPGGVEDLVARTPAEFRNEHRIDVRLRHEVVGIDLDLRRVEVRNLEHRRTFHLGFDQLMIGTGARPRRPDIDGIDLPFVHGVQTLDDAERLLASARAGDCRRVVVVGGGYIGIEMAEAFVERGAAVTLVEGGDQLMRSLDPDMAALVAAAVGRFGIDLRLRTRVDGFGEGVVHSEVGDLPADLVVLGLGVLPNSGLAADVGIETGVRGAIRVSRRQQTAVEGVWAAGDCAESYHLVSRRPIHVALGTVANRQARVAGTNIGGGSATYPGLVGTAITKLCGTEVARTGLTEHEAATADIDAVAATIESTATAGYLPDAPPITVKAVAERRTGRLLGMQIVGGRGSGKRIDAVAVALHAGFTCEQLVDADLAYAPPFGPVWDPVAIAARAAARAAGVELP